ncbi:hypothetical protein FKW77_002864 [Venturia effusa]|uniref:Zn(2)-C6 fungal-type domain-containing protein n=1 Tax=Venturia effusa TaxID=50376 RepID=A0A517LL26_9PEZI|nr:hypothetical protein FKW77_002864 [Venturia effusa]
MSRPQIGIDRLPQMRMSTEPRESMNCKSCRKRKIKCNRLRPACEACQVFACPCIYDAVPKKRGPKTDVLEALLKRVDGLEKRLRTEGKEDSPTNSVKEAIVEAIREGEEKKKQAQQPDGPRSTSDSTTISNSGTVNGNGTRASPPTPQQIPQPPTQLYPELLLDTYFGRIHGKPYHILDQASTRQRLLTGQLPNHLAYAIYALSARFASQYGGYSSAVQIGREYTMQARAEVDIDEPSIEALQTLLLLSQAMYQEGRGKKSYMYLSSAISMAFALNLHRELPSTLRVAPGEREGRRRLFWACYLLDRFAACGSKRPSLIADECVVLRLPCGTLQNGSLGGEGEYFQAAGNLQYMATGKPGHGSTSMLIGIVRILGITNRYLASGGVKGDSHFPWHSLSNLSKIRSDLDIWASETQDTFSSLESLFGQPDSATLVLSKLIYHLIHCLIYRPFLPVDLAELSGTTQHQSWQIEATNICFLHANAIAELVEIGKTSSSILDWPSFVGYCVCTAGTIHVHGAHYQGRDGEVFSTSADFLSREMHQLSELRYIWTGAQHQRDTLQAQYGAHSELVKSLASNPMRFSAVFHLEDFFDRYPGHFFDGAHITFADIAVDETLSRPPNKFPALLQIAIRLEQFLHPPQFQRVVPEREIEIVDFQFLAAGVAGVGFGFVADFYYVAAWTAIFNFQSLLLAILLLICTSTYIHSIVPGFMDRNKDGLFGIFWKCARIGERLSPYVSLACIGMAISVFFYS